MPAGFEIQIDNTGAPDGAAKHRTGAVYAVDSRVTQIRILQYRRRLPVILSIRRMLRYLLGINIGLRYRRRRHGEFERS